MVGANSQICRRNEPEASTKGVAIHPRHDGLRAAAHGAEQVRQRPALSVFGQRCIDKAPGQIAS